MDRLGAIWAAHRRNLRLVRRQPTLIAQTVILPTAILLLVAFIFGGAGGDAWPVAVVDDSNSDESHEFVDALRDSESTITPYFDIREMPLAEARQQVTDGRLHLLVHVPPGFADNREVRTTTYNVNTDAMKNVRLRIDYAITNEMEDTGQVEMTLAPAEDHNVWRSAYIGGSSVVLALLLGATLIAANLFAFEREHHTRSAAMLTPLGPATAGGGIVITATVVALVASLLPLGVSIWLFNLEALPARLVLFYGGFVPALIGFAGLGVLLGQTLSSFRNVQPTIVIGALVTFFGAGGFAGVAVLHPWLQVFADIWLPSRAFTWGNPVLHGFATIDAGQLVALGGAALAGVWMVRYAYRRELRASPQPPTS